MSRWDRLPSGATLERMSVVPEKRAAFVNDLYFRECWADLLKEWDVEIMP